MWDAENDDDAAFERRMASVVREVGERGKLIVAEPVPPVRAPTPAPAPEPARALAPAPTRTPAVVAAAPWWPCAQTAVSAFATRCKPQATRP